MSKLPVSVDAELVGKPAVVPLVHAMKANTLAQKHAARVLRNSMLSAGLAARAADPVVWNEWLQLQAAVMRRLLQQNLDWRNGCAVLADDYGQVRHANTMSKLAEKQYNLVSQWTKLVASQATSFVTLMENIHVDYGYWASQKLNYHQAP